MTRRQGPTKQLAPAMNPETKCPHRYVEEEGLQLEIDCSECPGAHDLANGKCLSGVLNVMAMGASPEAIILKRFIHKRYRGSAVSSACALATELAAINRALACQEAPSDRRCRTCPASPERILRNLRRKLLDEPGRYAVSRNALFDGFKDTAASEECERSHRCLESVLASTSSQTEVV